MSQPGANRFAREQKTLRIEKLELIIYLIIFSGPPGPEKNLRIVPQDGLRMAISG